MSENRETRCRRAPIFVSMDLDHDACYRAVETRDARFDGRFFTAVKTTGIYCRPVCPARTPKRENVIFYPTAAAAQEAGFRPCLRCRPETSPDLGAWRGASNTVSRALVLIEAGALDEGDVDALAGRLGVGERQLRRLFRRHLGASPVAVAQTRRVLLAKQLIHETRLSMTEVALAAGFGSVRRFNETFQQLYDRPPIALRRSGREPTSAAGAVTLKLPYKPPYDWDAILAFLAPRAIPGVEVVEAGATPAPSRSAAPRAPSSPGLPIATGSRDGTLSEAGRPASNHRPRAAAVRPCGRSADDRRTAVEGCASCAAARRPARPARTRRLGRLRGRRARHPWPADRRRRCNPDRR